MDDEVWDAVPRVLGGLIDNLKTRQSYPVRLFPQRPKRTPEQLRARVQQLYDACPLFDDGRADLWPEFSYLPEAFHNFRLDIFAKVFALSDKIADLEQLEQLYERYEDVESLICLFCDRFAEHLEGKLPLEETTQIIPTSVADALPDFPRYVRDVYGAVFNAFKFEDTLLDSVFDRLEAAFVENTLTACKITREDANKHPHKLELPDEKCPDPMVYLRGTPFEELLETQILYPIPAPMRFEHHHIVAGTGHGKTQTIQNLICHDLVDVAAGDASVIVVDSQGDLIGHISRLRWFYDGALKDKLTLIEPKDIEYPVVLNLFDVNLDRLGTYTPLIREQALNGIIELYDFVFGSLLGAEMTSKQGTLFRYIMRLMMHIPDANIQTFRKLMEPDGYERFKPYIDQLQGTARAFFETEFESREFKQTKSQVLRRLWAILENATFERMFSHPRNKFDLFSEMNAGRVILISTSKDLLKQNGSQIFGRFFIAMIAQACMERAALPPEKRTPCYVYIDEAQDYLDENVALILEQARKYNVGLIMAHQYLGQLSPKLQEAFAANTSIKMAGGVSARDARAMAQEMRVTPEFIERQPVGSFATSLKGRILTYQTRFGLMEGLDRMSDDEFAEIRSHMREKYAVHYSQISDSDNQIEEHIGPSACVDEPEEDPTVPAKAW